MTWTRVMSNDELPPGQSKMVLVGNTIVALFNVDGTVYAIDDACPHQGAPLSEGRLDGCVVSCPWHRVEVDVTSGRLLSGPGIRDVACYAIKIDGEVVWVDVPDSGPCRRAIGRSTGGKQVIATTDGDRKGEAMKNQLPEIELARAYDAVPQDNRHYRVLVDRLWPRGVSKEKLNLDEWAKEFAPSNDLRRWFNHDPDRWDEFRQRYLKELDEIEGGFRSVIDDAGKRTILLIYGAKDERHNQAVVLKEWLLKHHGPPADA
ncbi:Biphenyl dioxygenase ferredoxin subunit [Stieleria maiorica]|uniref:Biphenyl dioxygenase ferredoxin subunit n=1 Tax=Stieleria maiorica TaxID=2795974 RepID=A0A5B9ME54_9BACT|nr:DUF488 family protein [Stieleria maiorica]QEF97775.1 Biphenyl dioxygenase ferredoxin subunit [Stieleria maiorica]